MLLTESVNGKVNYGPQCKENPPEPSGESLFCQNIFGRQSSMAFRNVMFVKSLLLDSHLNNRRKKSLVGVFIYWAIPSPRGGGFILGWEQQSRSNLFPYFPPLYCQQIFPTRLDATPLIEEFGFKKQRSFRLNFGSFATFTWMLKVWQSDSIWTPSKTWGDKNESL